MTELGARLKEARIAKGYSLDDLQEKTKIQKRYLSAIEEGNYGVMPGTFYVRAFIKQYAEAVDLDATELLETYKTELPTNKTAETLGSGVSIQKGDQVSGNKRRSNVARSSGPNKKFGDVMPKFVVALFIVVIIAGFAFLMLKQPSNTVEEPKETPKTQENTNVDTSKNNATDATDKKEDTTKEETKKEDQPKQKLSDGEVSADNITTTYTLSGTKKFSIRVDVTGENWVGITDENGTTLGESGMFAAGDQIKENAKGKKSVRIRLGAAANGKVFVNGEEVKFVTSPSEQPTQNIVIKLAEEE